MRLFFNAISDTEVFLALNTIICKEDFFGKVSGWHYINDIYFKSTSTRFTHSDLGHENVVKQSQWLSNYLSECKL